MPRRSARGARQARSRGRSYHHGDLANALVCESLELVEAGGLEAFSLREAASRCGVAVSAAYKHYASKGELLSAVADRGFAALGDRMESIARHTSRGLAGRAMAEARLVAVGRAYILFAAEHPQLFRLMFGPSGPKGGRGDPRGLAPAHRLSQILVEALTAVAHEYGRKDLDVDTSKVVAWSLVHGFATMVVDGLWNETSRKALDAMIAELGASMLRSLA